MTSRRWITVWAFAAAAILCLSIGAVAAVSRSHGPSPAPTPTLRACERYSIHDTRWKPCAYG